MYSAIASRAVSPYKGELSVFLYTSNRRSGERWRIGRGQMCGVKGDKKQTEVLIPSVLGDRRKSPLPRFM